MQRVFSGLNAPSSLLGSHENRIQDLNERASKALEIIHNKLIKENPDGSFRVYSQTRKGVSHAVVWVYNGGERRWLCGSIGCIQSGVSFCKHTLAVTFYLHRKYHLALPLYVPQLEPPLFQPQIVANQVRGVGSDEAGTQAMSASILDETLPIADDRETASVTTLRCPRCGSSGLGHNGSAPRSKNSDERIPLYRCKGCDYPFREPSLLPRYRYELETVSKMFALYFDNMSYRGVRRNLQLEGRGTCVRASTIYKIVDRLIPKVYEFVLTLEPRLTGVWHIDEMDVLCRGGFLNKKNNTQHAWFCNVEDEGRFALASDVLMTKDAAAIASVLLQAKVMAKQSPTSMIVHDKGGQYPGGIQMAFARDVRKPVDYAVLGGAGQKNGNQRIERLNNIFRERIKIQRGWKTRDSPLVKGLMIHYNFVRPHMNLGERTPAEEAGLSVIKGQDSPDKWHSLLTKTLEFHQKLRIPPSTVHV